MRSIADIRSTFLQYFSHQEHEVVPSSSLIPRNDPTLLFTSAGMIQFKDVFTGLETRPYKRAASAQKCLRAGGKHNDLENVGYTARHHTFFEMLGNFSFGDYFKEEAIVFAWELITREFALSKDRLLVTVYAEDEEAARLWRKIANFPEEKIIRISTDDNFWSMGDTGPCGPCSEIFYDHGEKIKGGPPGSPDEDGDRFMEFWNLVFMQFEQLPDGSRAPLPKPSIDTGMGLERIATILQGVHSNYDTDLFRTLIQASEDLTKTKGHSHRHSHQVIADHLRACAFLIADGVMPSNEGRGYVLRRIMRRAMRHVHLLGAKEPLMYRLVETLVGLMGHAYPELPHAEAAITETLRLEEEKFRQTLDRGLKLLNDDIATLTPTQPFPGSAAFKLYDTYGFPLDLTQDILRGQGRTVEIEGFNVAMDAQRAAARASWVGSGETKEDTLWYTIREQYGASEFLGYEVDQAEGIVQALVVDGQRVDKVSKGQTLALVVNQTPFYGESGGQMGDTGTIVSLQGCELRVTDTQKKVGSLQVHLAEVLNGTLAIGGVVKLMVDRKRRNLLRANHSATHLVHAALRHYLGTHVIQKGSLVAPDRLRFDFSYPRPLTTQELNAVELLVNQNIQDNQPVATRLMSPEDAIAQGAMALFGEQYGNEVRVVSMGEENGSDHFSTELCGGTHVSRTGDIGFFKIIGEAGIAAGIRRLEALTGQAAVNYVASQGEILTQLAALMKTSPTELPTRLKTLLADRKNLERQSSANVVAQASLGKRTTQQIGSWNLISQQLEGVPSKDLKPLVDDLKNQIGSGVIIVTSIVDEKVSLVIGVTVDLIDQISAIDLARIGTEVLGGKGGGGRPDLAQAGGPDRAKVSQIVPEITAFLQKKAE